MAEAVLWESHGHVRLLTLNRPEALNALNREVERLEERCLLEFRDDPEAWALVVTGAGRAFCAGLDLKEGVPEDAGRPRTLIGPDPLEIFKPIIAAIGGYAVGAGLELAMACDIRLAADDARLGLPEVKRGMIPGAGGCQRLPRLIGLSRALLMMYTGEVVDAAAAEALGLVQRVVPREALVPEALALAQQICENAPLAVRAVKEAAVRGIDLPLRAALAQERLVAARLKGSADQAEGIRAFAEKRRPVWRGR